MGRGALEAFTRLYLDAFGVGHWAVSARWVEACESDTGPAAGSCEPDPVYHQAKIELLWPPPGDVEETIAHEVAHCLTAELALLADARPGTWARAAWERVAEQMARGAVALRRHGARTPQILARVMRSKSVALRRDSMPDASKIAELAMKAGELGAREDVPEEIKAFLQELVAALAGGELDMGDDTAGGELPAAADGAMPEQEPAYARVILARMDKIEEALSRGTAAPAAPLGAAARVSPELAEQRQLVVQGILTTKPGLLSAEGERELVARGDPKLARFVVAEVERRVDVERRGAGPARRGGGHEPHVDRATITLTPAQARAAKRHNLTPEAYARTLSASAGHKAALKGGK